MGRVSTNKVHSGASVVFDHFTKEAFLVAVAGALGMSPEEVTKGKDLK